MPTTWVIYNRTPRAPFSNVAVYIMFYISVHVIIYTCAYYIINCGRILTIRRKSSRKLILNGVWNRRGRVYGVTRTYLYIYMCVYIIIRLFITSTAHCENVFSGCNICYDVCVEKSHSLSYLIYILYIIIVLCV